MASRLGANVARSNFAFKRYGISARAYAIASGSARPARVAYAKPAARAAPRTASTFASSADIEAALGEVTANGAESATESASPFPAASQTANTISDPLPEPLDSTLTGPTTDWSRSFQGLGEEAFPKEIADILLAPVDPGDVEMKPDGLAYLPEIKYRRVLNKAFGPGGWGLAPRSQSHVGPKVVSREYALICRGRLVAVARGEQEYFDPHGVATAVEACKSNALMRCCKDLGIASELWDPRFIREFKSKHCVEVFAEHATTKKKKKLWRRKDQPKFDYPWKE